MSMPTPPSFPSNHHLPEGTVIHRGLLSLIGSPPQMVQEFDATCRHGYGPLRVHLSVGRTPIHLVGVQAIRCAVDLAGRMGNTSWVGLSDDDVAKAALSEIQFRYGMMERGLLRHISPLQRVAFHLGMTALEQTLTVISLAKSGLHELLPGTLANLMVVYSCAALTRDLGRVDRESANQAKHAAEASVRAWRNGWISASLEERSGQESDSLLARTS